MIEIFYFFSGIENRFCDMGIGDLLMPLPFPLPQTESVIQMLMTASELIPTGPESHNQGHMRLGDAHTLVRVLCHKKDREASQFLKLKYQLPASSGEYCPCVSMTDEVMASPLIGLELDTLI